MAGCAAAALPSMLAPSKKPSARRRQLEDLVIVAPVYKNSAAKKAWAMLAPARTPVAMVAAGTCKVAIAAMSFHWGRQRGHKIRLESASPDL